MSSQDYFFNQNTSGRSSRSAKPSSSGKNKLSFLLNDDGNGRHADQPTSSSRTHSGKESSGSERQRKFVCETCKFGFYTRSDLQKHVSAVHLKLRPFDCPLCDKKFGEKSNATKHFRSVHARQKNAACDQCDAVFAFRDGLVRHVRLVHEGVRNFRCTVPGCRSDAFKQAAHLKKHLSSVHKQGNDRRK